MPVLHIRLTLPGKHDSASGTARRRMYYNRALHFPENAAWLNLPRQQAISATPWRSGAATFTPIPELGCSEHRTSQTIAERLRETGMEVHTGTGGTGVVGVLQRGNSPRKIGLRADMDALAILEKNEFEHRSKFEGRMHACGHDGHVSMLLGAAHHLAGTGAFDGTVYFIFQPAEEKYPGLIEAL